MEKGIWNYAKDLETEHRATRQSLIGKGKTYRSRDVAFENGYLHALLTILDEIERPEKNRQLEEAMARFGKVDR